ncbi:MAG: ATP-binding protein [Leptolyngbyaceae cyanobacterium RM2_2_4]|nr:ATP-binding protein [Leptolyngbyaceae cyanobacterium SM1_4_3]NJN56318.1 ATP-binding protein [Leptolyngbyaceae cyanobacterium SL_5_9]NJO48834.1 ATP-binding protein [Leptolyngbyaceae cyanobacterium RM2_2_4]
MKVFKKAHLQVNTDLSELTQVLSWFDQFNSAIIPPSVWLQCQLALAEGFTNAVRHAHQNCPEETPIDMEITLFDQALEIRIWDIGAGFDLSQKLDEMPPEIDQDAEGGRGLKLMQQMSDLLSYTQTGDRRNCLLIVKKLEGEEA